MWSVEILRIFVMPRAQHTGVFIYGTPTQAERVLLKQKNSLTFMLTCIFINKQ